MEIKRVILARFVDFHVTPTKVFPMQPDVKFSTMFFVNNGHRAIKVCVNKVLYFRAGHILYI